MFEGTKVCVFVLNCKKFRTLVPAKNSYLKVDRTKTWNGLGNGSKNGSKNGSIKLEICSPYVVGRAFTVVVYQHWSAEHPCKFLRLRAQLAQYTASWSRSSPWRSGNEVRRSQSSGTIKYCTAHNLMIAYTGKKTYMHRNITTQ